MCWVDVRGFAKKKIHKIRDFYGRGWVDRGLTLIFVGENRHKNCPKLVLIFWSSIPCSVCICIAKKCWLL